jgi:hypothetical protein
MSRVVFTPVPPEDPEPRARVVFTPPPQEPRSIAELRVPKKPEDKPARSGRPSKRSRPLMRRIDAMIDDNRSTISVAVAFAVATAVSLLLYVLIRPE